MLSRELRTPLAAMLDYVEVLQEGIYGAPPEKFLRILTRIRSNGKHLLGLINTVLDISKIEAGQFKHATRTRGGILLGAYPQLGGFLFSRNS